MVFTVLPSDVFVVKLLFVPSSKGGKWKNNGDYLRCLEQFKVLFSHQSC